MFKPHPNSRLNDLFAARPFQGADPRDATLLFVGLDANYDESLEHSPAFQSVLEYHEDGVTFWHRHGVHHPFLLPSYRGDGRSYHRNFAKIGFGPEHAEHISFVELLHVPTVGRNRLTAADLDKDHLAWLDAAIHDGKARHIFVSDSVSRLMHATRAFPWLRAQPTPDPTFPRMYDTHGKTVYKHLHFSYPYDAARSERERRAISSLLKPPGPLD